MAARWMVLGLCCLGGARAFDVGADTRVSIGLAREATLAERTAARELADYLSRVLGRPCGQFAEGEARPDGAVIWVGPTSAAAQAGLLAGEMGPEEWHIRSAGGDLMVVGGRPRGTLYAAYHLLEDLVGVRWWSPWEEDVPRRAELRLGPVELAGRPAFRYRDIYMLYGHDGGRFAARRRLNRDGDRPIAAEYGGSLTYGPPYHVHTFFMCFPPEQHFDEHPEWYSLIDGRRVGDRTQLCLTNPELREAFLTKLRGYIAESHAAAVADQLPPPLVFSVSQNDWANPCGCGPCQAIVEAEGTEAGPLLEFVNYLADGIRDDYPEVYLDTLAYQYTQRAPRRLRCRDNVIVRLCDTEADMLKPITAEANRAFREHIESWAEVCANLRIWDYAVTYANPLGMPLPTTHTYGPDYRYYAAHRVEGVFTELEYPLLADLRDFKVWLMTKLLEDPRSDDERLTDEFMNGYFGAAGQPVKAYLRDLEAEAEQRQSSSTCWVSSPNRLSYVNLAFMVRAHGYFDRAETAVAEAPELLRRVRFARLSLDRATLAAYAKLMSEWLNTHDGPDGFPFDRDAIGARALATWQAEADRRLPDAERQRERLAAEGEIRRYAMVPGALPPPAAFADRPRGTVFDYTAIMTRNWQDIVQVVPDEAAESGITNRLDLTAAGVEHPERYVLPMPSGVYGTIEKSGLPGKPIAAEDIPGPGYHWYRLGSFVVRPGYYLYFFWSWIIQLDIDNVWDPAEPEREFEIWARIKFEGPRFPHAQPGESDAICIERVVLARAEAAD